MCADVQKRSSGSSGGFTLVEVLIVMVIMGIVVTAIYSLYTDTNRTATTSEEIVEVQQNLRIALDQVSRDLRMAGFLVPSNATGLLSAPERSIDVNNNGVCSDTGESPGPGGNCFSFQTATLSGRIARITDTPSGASPSDTNADYSITVASSEMVDLFETGQWVRIIRPADTSPPLARVFRVSGTSRAPTPTLTLKGFNAATIFRPGDLIVRVIDLNKDGDGDPNTDPPPPLVTATYRLIDDATSTDPSMRILVRTEMDTSGATPQILSTAQIAGKITDIRFSYLLDSGIEVSSVTNAARLGEITAVRVTILGATDVTQTGNERFSGVKTRQVESVVKLRNR